MSDAPWRLGGRFDLLGALGTGAAGTVWRGREVADGSEHAVKLLRPELVTDEPAVTRLYATLNSVGRLGHPGIVAVDDAVAADGWLALRSRLVPGESLRALLSRQGALPPGQAADLIAKACDILAAAHAAGIAHGDLHAGNVLLGSAGLVLTDFGMADLVNHAGTRDAAAAPAVAAPPAEYRAPELDSAQPIISAPADVYAAGVLLYECLAGRPPFVAQWPDTVAQMHRVSPPPPIPGLADSLSRIVAACLAKDSRYRPTASQLAEALHGEAAASGVVAASVVASGAAAPQSEAMHTQVLPIVPGMGAASAVADTTTLSGYRGDGMRDGGSAGNGRLPRVITDHKTESGIAAAVVVVGLLIGAALSMGAGGSNTGSTNAAAGGQPTPSAAATTLSSTPQAVVLPSASASPSPSASPSASVSGPATGTMTFINAPTGKCMDTQGRIFAAGTTEDIYDCNGTPAQSWTVTSGGQLTEDGGAFCLDDYAFGNTPGTKVVAWTCNGGANQQWTLRPDGSIISNSANLCIDVTGQGNADFTPLVLQTCDGGPSQQWTRQ